MKRVWMFVAASVIVLMLSCTKRIYVPVEHRRSEMVVMRDTVVEIVTYGEKLSNRTTDTLSCLYGDGVSSVAIVSDGVLSHTLMQHPRRDSVRVQLPEVHITDSIPYIVPLNTTPSPPLSIPIGLIFVILMVSILFLTVLSCAKR